MSRSAIFNYPRAPRRGFAAGTLVHTKAGLVPIEQVRVGDWVLSQPRAGTGAESAYRQVVGTSSAEDQEVTLVRCYKSDGSALQELCVARWQLFFTKDHGWTADMLGLGSTLACIDGVEVVTLCGSPVYGTMQAGIGWAMRLWTPDSDNGQGHCVDLRDGSIVVATEESWNLDVLDDEGNFPDFSIRVYSLDIEACQPWYAGALGVTIHHPDAPDGPVREAQ